MTTTLAFITLPTELYYTQADEMGCTFVGTKQECIEAIKNVFPDENAEELFKKHFSDNWDGLYPLVRNGKLEHYVLVGADEPGYVDIGDTTYVIPESEAVAAGYDAENRSW